MKKLKNKNEEKLQGRKQEPAKVKMRSRRGNEEQFRVNGRKEPTH